MADTPMVGRMVVVNDRMQQGYQYELSEPVGCNFDPDFAPELTPAETLRLGVFCGKYITDGRGEFPEDWFVGAKSAPGHRDCSLNFFGVDASLPLSGWRAKGWLPTIRAAGFNGTALLYGPPHAGRGSPADQALEGDAPPCPADRAQLR
jgi:hypothetical protein